MNDRLLTERERMLAGGIYDSRDPELLALAHRARSLLARYNGSQSTDAAGRRELLQALLAEIAPGVWVEPPFFCDYGVHVVLGAHSFVNANCVFLDAAPIHVGAHSLIGPGVQLLTATHPVRAADRRAPGWSPTSTRSPYRTRAAPIRIGEECWIGAGTLVMPGVTIGDRTTIGAGSIVTGDIPDDVLAFGQPCEVRRRL